MLAVRQPPSRMGSSQPDSDPFQMPFGYSVDGNQEPLFDAPEPAPGAPLLSETDSKFLSDFFDDMTANQYNMPSFGEGLNYNAWFDLPPQLMGTATSYGSQSAAPLGQESHLNYTNDSHSPHMGISGSHLMPPPPPPPSQPNAYQQHPSDDVLNAAATLMQNGPGMRGGHKNNDSSTPRRPLGPPVGHLRHQGLEEFREESRKGMASTEIDNTFTEWMWGSGSKGRQNSTTRAIPVDYQWGSDSNFNLAQGYTPEANNKDTVETQHQEQLKCLECLEPNQSAATTRPSSPTNSQSTFPIGLHRDTSESAERPDDDDDAPPRKRRKSKIKKDSTEEGEDQSTNGSKSAAAKRRKAKGDRNGSISSPPMEVGMGKRRKSALNGVKPPRENLSEEQKRENHIRSEQKRRTLIKEGFDDLCEIVPGLNGGGFSKSTMLTMTADWLEELLVGNRDLTAQLAALEGR
ncbi:hypothetical protein CFAM422_007064 [Trichoderma lentiforme]|uniref:BHLH domain-containing protein n=1 Tax=Trichoderma lentiforme TaxID=1567552 RepID=A0A9P4XDG4_9HYPO|nr:hypothetical protein CFAM422_007064 [Trichoderma lentiforme]